jgi:RNA polymerase sigma-70 factor (ECF subfamily)
MSTTPPGPAPAEPGRTRRFEQAALPHLDAAYSLARWLTGSDADAQDVVQDAYLRAFRHFDGFAGGDARPWLLAIVRNTCWTWLGRNRPRALVALEEDDGKALAIEPTASVGMPDDPEAALIASGDERLLAHLLAELPEPFREVMVLRELEDLSYQEIAAVAGIPIGTVMSRLARARRRLQQAWRQRQQKEAAGGL